MPAPLPFTAPWLLAPMEGVTETCFRGLVLERNPPETLGGAFTEFVKVSEAPHSVKVLRKRLGEQRHAAPVGLQLMGAEPGLLAVTARRAELAGAPLLDLNFGCPAKGALAGCGGSAVLQDPRRLESIVRACADAVERIPVTAKLRSGYDDDGLLDELVRAAEAGGAALISLHCRTKAEGFKGPGDWSRIARTVEAVGVPVCGNGGVDVHADLGRMRAETGCAYVMVGRAALADPWIFCGREVTPDEAARFLLDYAEALAGSGRPPSRVIGRVKQLLATWTAGGLVDEDRDAWRREPDAEVFLARLRRAAAPAHGER